MSWFKLFLCVCKQQRKRGSKVKKKKKKRIQANDSIVSQVEDVRNEICFQGCLSQGELQPAQPGLGPVLPQGVSALPALPGPASPTMWRQEVVLLLPLSCCSAGSTSFPLTLLISLTR